MNWNAKSLWLDCRDSAASRRLNELFTVTYEYFFCSSALDKKLFPKTLNQVTFEENINSNLFLFIQLSGICLLLVSIFQIEFLNALLDELRVCICSIFEDTSTRKVDLAVEGT